MSYAIVYSSRTGNTELLARAIQSALPAEDCLYFGGPDAADLDGLTKAVLAAGRE